jgi:hypothetical protein
MDKFSVDYGTLGEQMTQRKAYRFKDVKDRLVKVAFDIVRFRDTDNIDGLWQIQATDDGEVIVAMYEQAPEKLEAKASNWAAVADKTGSVNVFYKDEPIMRFASAKIGIPADGIPLLVESLPEKLEKNASLRKAMLNEISPEERKDILAKYPELNK